MEINLQDYINFRKNYQLKEDFLNIKDNEIYFGNEIVVDKNGNKFFEGQNFIDISFNAKNDKASVLSNLFMLEFEFMGKKVKSIEGIFQGIKYKTIELQNLVLNYWGMQAYHTRAVNVEFWGDEGTLYWQGQEMKRDSEQYQEFIDEVYISACKNPIYTNTLLSTKDKYLLHHIGKDNIFETVLTRYEFELRLNSLRDYLKLINFKIVK